jgi:uncharacterized membrane protein
MLMNHHAHTYARPFARLRNLPCRFAVILLLVAAVSHIVTTFQLTAGPGASAYQRLTEAYAAHSFHQLARSTERRAGGADLSLPFIGADATHAVCHFNSDAGPVSINAVLPDIGWTVGVFHPDGSAAYYATASPGRPSTVEITVLSTADQFRGLTPQALGQVSIRPPGVTVVAQKGFVLIRAPDRGLSYEAAQLEALSQARCEQTPHGQPAAL